MTSNTTTATLHADFDPVHGSQAAFRVLLNALARPGLIERIPAPALHAPANAWAAAALLTLTDHETTLGCSGDGLQDLVAYVQRRTGVRQAVPSQADFVVAGGAAPAMDLVPDLRLGSFAYPDEGATLVLLVDELRAGGPEEGAAVLSGPGVDGAAWVRVAGLDAGFFAARQAAVDNYPLGFDTLLIDRDGSVIGLPRTTRAVLKSEG